MNVVLRAATHEDYEDVCALYDQLTRVHALALPHFFRPVEGTALSRERFEAILANEDAALFVAEHQAIQDKQETLIGMVSCYVLATPPFLMVVPRRIVHIEDLIVSEHVRQQGVGQMLTERVHEWAREQGITEIELDVWEFPTSALAFYEKLGYHTTRRRMRKQLP